MVLCTNTCIAEEGTVGWHLIHSFPTLCKKVCVKQGSGWSMCSGCLIWSFMRGLPHKDIIIFTELNSPDTLSYEDQRHPETHHKHTPTPPSVLSHAALLQMPTFRMQV